MPAKPPASLIYSCECRIRKKKNGDSQPQELERLLKQAKGSILSIDHTSVGGTI